MLNHTLWEKPNTSFRKPPCLLMASLVVQTVKNPPAMWDTRVRSLGQENPLENKMATHCNILAWKVPRMEEPGRLQSMGSLRVGHDYNFTFTFHFHVLEKETATHSSVLAWRIPGTGEPDGLCVYGVAQSQTRLKRLSSSSGSSSGV